MATIMDAPTAATWIVPPEEEIPSELKAARAALDQIIDCPCDCTQDRIVLPGLPFDDD